MTANFANSTYSFVAPSADQIRARRAPGPLGWVSSAAQWLIDMPRRRAVINELDALSDHELADIGLNRVDVPRVFDVSFASQRSPL